METLDVLPETDRVVPPHAGKKGADLGDFAEYFANQLWGFDDE